MLRGTGVRIQRFRINENRHLGRGRRCDQHRVDTCTVRAGGYLANQEPEPHDMTTIPARRSETRRIEFVFFGLTRASGFRGGQGGRYEANLTLQFEGWL